MLTTLGIRGFLVGSDDVTGAGNPAVSGNCYIPETEENIKITVYQRNGRCFFMDGGGDTEMEVYIHEVKWMICSDDIWCIELEIGYKA
jgi:hypothetical protein